MARSIDVTQEEPAIRQVRNFSELGLAMRAAVEGVEHTLEALIPKPQGPQRRVHEAMRYSVFAGGKRLRPFLVLSCAELFGAERGRALRVAAAIEVLHTYSLVHDDLPCMDDDDLRRGRPTAHVAFDEATAVLAGDALLTLAFEILCSPETHPSGDVRCELAVKLAEAGGSFGMIGGQMVDMQTPGRAPDAGHVVLLQRMKTGALFDFSCLSGAILAGAGAEHRNRLKVYARDFGLAYQITDDLLDAVGSEEKTGKAVGKDVEQGKATLISIHGLAGARDEAEKLVRSAVAVLEPYGAKASNLRDLAFFLLDRES
jgi:farnesyl diphosphate synthase